jgi:hypothetical protein
MHFLRDLHAVNGLSGETGTVEAKFESVVSVIVRAASL